MADERPRREKELQAIWHFWHSRWLVDVSLLFDHWNQKKLSDTVPTVPAVLNGPMQISTTCKSTWQVQFHKNSFQIRRNPQSFYKRPKILKILKESWKNPKTIWSNPKESERILKNPKESERILKNRKESWRILKNRKESWRIGKNGKEWERIVDVMDVCKFRWLSSRLVKSMNWWAGIGFQQLERLAATFLAETTQRFRLFPATTTSGFAGIDRNRPESTGIDRNRPEFLEKILKNLEESHQNPLKSLKIFDKIPKNPKKNRKESERIRKNRKESERILTFGLNWLEISSINLIMKIYFSNEIVWSCVAWLDEWFKWIQLNYSNEFNWIIHGPLAT